MQDYINTIHTNWNLGVSYGDKTHYEITTTSGFKNLNFLVYPLYQQFEQGKVIKPNCEIFIWRGSNRIRITSESDFDKSAISKTWSDYNQEGIHCLPVIKKYRDNKLEESNKSLQEKTYDQMHFNMLPNQKKMDHVCNEISKILGDAFQDVGKSNNKIDSNEDLSGLYDYD